MDKPKAKYAMSDSAYNVLKNFALIILPAVAAAYFTLSGIWGFPYAEQVVGTITVVETFLGAVLKISQVSYEKVADGTMSVNPEGLASVRFNIPANEAQNKKTVNLAVKNVGLDDIKAPIE